MIIRKNGVEMYIFLVFFSVVSVAQAGFIDPELTFQNIDWRYPDYIVNPLPPCPKEGVFTHPRNCTWYYRCHQIIGIKFFRRFYFRCEFGTVFSDKYDQCLFPKDKNDPCNYNSMGNAYPTTLRPMVYPPYTTKLPDDKSSTQNSQLHTTSSNNVTPTEPPDVITNTLPTIIDQSDPKTCTAFHSLCKQHHYCLHNGYQGTIYLCAKAYFECQPDHNKVNFCKADHLYDKDNHLCVSNLCVLSTYEAEKLISSVVTSSQTNIKFSLEKASIIKTIHTTIQDIVQVDLIQNCFLIYSKCIRREFCYSNNERGFHKVCSKVILKCTSNGKAYEVCPMGNYFDPSNAVCVSDICPVSITFVIINSVHINSIKSLTITNENETTPVIALEGSECVAVLNECQFIEVCDLKGERRFKYLCSNSNYVCSNQKIAKPICPEGKLFDPEYFVCVFKMCPLTTVHLDLLEEKNHNENTHVCLTTYMYCSYENTCNGYQEFRKRLLCKKAFRKCDNQHEKHAICRDNDLYNANTNSCIKKACPLVNGTKNMNINDKIFNSNIQTTTITSIANVESSYLEILSSNHCKITATICNLKSSCNSRGKTITNYVCQDAYIQCTKNLQKLCSNNKLYDPITNVCILKLCPLVTSSVTITETGTESGGGSSQTSGSNTTTSTTVVTEGVETSVAEKCTSSYSQCRQYEFCSESQATGTLYLCAKAFYLCQNTNIQKDLCSEGQLYDPKNNQCVVQLCVLITKEIIVVSTSIETVETGSETGSGSVTTVTDTSNQGETGSSITTTGQQCFSSYSRCKNYETCDDNGQKMSQYLCIDAFEQCNGDKRNLCSTGDFYDPENNACIQKLCPLVTSSVTITVTGTTTITESGGGSSQTSGSNTTTSTTVVTEGVETSVAEKCTSSYSQCRQYEFCSESQATGTLYLCAKAFYLCQNTNIQKDLCSEGQLYDPKKNQCVVQLCVLITKEIIVVSTSIETVETGSETGSGSVTTVIDTSNQGETGSSITTSGQQCFSSYSRCKNYETCDDNGQKMSQYLCIDAFEQCNGDKRNLCSTGDFYDPENNACIQKLCPLVTSSVTITVTGTTTITESGGGSSQTSGSNTTTSTTVVTEGVETSVAEKCTSSYSQCRQYEFCSESQATGTLYLCAKAFYLCQNTNIQKDLCSEGQLYDPKKNQCVVQLCVLITKEIIVVSTSIETVETGSETGSGSVTTVIDTSNQGETGSSITTTGQQCFSSYSRCKNYETCDDNGQKMSQYLCIDAFEQCNGDKRNLCSTGDFYDPENNACIQKLCPLVTSSVTITVTGTTTITESGGGSSQTSGSNTTTSTTVVTEGVETSVAEKCTSSYSQCRQYEFCSESQATGTLYLCAKAFYLCQNTNIQKDLCSEGQLYDPKNNQCVVQLCVLITKEIIVVSTSIETVETGSETGSGSVTTVTDTSNQGETGSSITTTGQQCFSSYSRCKNYETCDDNGQKMSQYLCIDAFEQCNGDKRNLCSTGDFYDPENNACIQKLCPLVTSSVTITVTGTTTITESSGGSSQTSGSNTTTSTTVVTEGVETSVAEKCTSSYSQCRQYEFCSESQATGTLYLCAKAFYLCQNTNIQKDLCSEGQLYDPKKNQCVVQLCVLITKEIIVVSTSIETVETGSETGSGSVTTVIDTSNQGETGSPITTTGQQCFSSYSRCKNYETCDDNGQKMSQYLCIDAFEQCNGDKRNLCSTGDFYDPENNACIQKLCPLVTSSVTITVTGTTTITESGGGSSQTSGSNTTTSTTVVTEGVETSVAEKCTSSYSQCRQYEFCSESQATGTLYLCAKAFYLCQNTNIQKDLCSEGQLYDPKKNQCVVQLCVLITKEIIVVSTSIETVETGSETGSGSVTTVIDTSNQGETGSSITTTGQQCFSSYSRCKNYETCDDNGQKMSQYLCIDAFEQCNGDKRNLCSTGDFYDPENYACIQKLCPLVTSSVTITVTGTTTITESSGGSSQTSGSNTTTSTTVVTEGVETSVAEKCTSSYSQCRQYEFCSESQATGTLYLCAKAFYLCQNTNIQKDLCSEGQLYDPKKNQCVVQLCVLITKEIIVVSTSIETVETGSETGSGSVTTVIDTSNQGETGSSITTTGQQCFSSYSRCKNYETCDDNGQKMSQYLCIDAFEQCNGDKRNLCSTGDFYDPENNACIQKLCPLVTSSVTITVTGTTTITESGGGSSQTSGSNTTTSTTVVTEGVETSVAEKCTSSYSQCRQYEFCSESQATGTLYLCAKAFYLCQNTNIQKDLCSEGQLYDPKNNQCVVQLCVLITKEIIVVSTSIETVETGSETGSGSVTTLTDTSNQGETGSSITTTGQQCFSSYSKCKNYETCDDNGQKMSQYLCIDAFEQCNGDKRNLCSTGDFYDPENNACIQKLCPLVTSSVTITVTGTTTITESGGGSSQTSGSNTTTSTTVVTEGVETSVAEKCTSSYSQCRQYEFCSESQATGTLYLCAKAFYLCQNTNIQKDLCSEGQLYDPKKNQCVVQLCVLITKEIIVVSTSIETVETGSETGSGSVTTVIDTSNQGETGSSITTTGQQCFSSYSRCKNYETCDDNGQKMSQYLCIDAFEQCNGDKRNLCSTGDFYDPENNACIQKLCPLVTSSVTITVTGTTTITESGGGSSQTSGSNTTTSTTVVTEGVETSVAEKCTSSYSQCRQYEFCSESQATGTLYLCAKAFYLCQNTNIQKDLCSEGQLYDPKKNQCVVQLCVLITKEIIVVSTSIETVETGSETGSGSVTTVIDTSNQGETGSSITTTGQQCFSSYSRCKNYETCDDNGQKMSQYLCIDAFEQCNGDKRNLCSTGDFYDPENNACIQKLCPLVTSSVTITVTGTTTITESGGGSSQTSGSNTTTSTTVVTEGVETSVAEKCTSSYSQCRQYEFCSESQATGTLYLCAKAFYLCQNTNIQKDLCSEGQLYDPKNNQCVVQLCVLITKEIIVVSTSIETVETGSETGSGSVTTVTDTSNQGETGSSITTTGQQCFSSYSRCKNYETCDDNGQKMSQYLCIDAFEQCNGDKRNLCSTGDFYDPENNACIQKLCPLVTSSVTITVTGTTTITESGGGSSQTSGSNTTTSTTVVTEGVETSVAEKCTSSYSQCRQYEFCSESQATGTLYLCAKAFYLCQNTNIQKDLCSEGQLYDPKNNQCVVQLCVLITKEIIVVSTSIETVETGSETGSGSVTTVTDTSNQGETGSSITTTGQQCFSSYSRCKNYETCDDNGQKMSQYLCIDAFEQCNGDKRNLCSTGDLYNPENNACIQKLCPLVTSSVTITVTGTTTITESGGGSSHTSGSNTTTSTTVVTEGVETSVAEKCTSSYSQCRQYEFCSESQATGTLYLCAKAFYLCQNTNIQKDLCSEGQLYDPKNNQCIVHLCVLITKEIIVVSTSIETVETGSETGSGSVTTVTDTSNQGETGSSITTTGQQCFSSYSRCKNYETCDDNGQKMSQYLCIDAFEQCNGDKRNLCSTGDFYDPENNACIQKLCPLVTSSVTITVTGTTTITESGGGSSQTSGSNTTTSTTVVTEGVETSVAEKCTSSYSQCRQYEFCSESQATGTLYLCATAFYLCQNTNIQKDLCSEGQLYDPKNNQCVVQLCVLITKEIIVVSTSIETVETGSETGSGSVTTVTDTSNQGETGSSITTTGQQCFSSYSRCKNYETCDDNGQKMSQYLCIDAFEQCNGDKRNLCSTGDFYDPENNACIQKLCPLVTSSVTITVTGTTTITESGGGSSQTSGSNTTTSTTVVTEGVETSVAEKCTSSYSQCRQYEFCSESQATGTLYLCAKAFYLCQNTNIQKDLCSEGQLYDPKKNQCVVQLCVLITKEIIVVSTSIETVETGSETGSGSVTTVTDTSNQGETGSSITTTGQQCFSSYSRCKNYETCDDNGQKMSQYLCIDAFEQCNGDKRNLCSTGDFYDPENNACIQKLCPLVTSSVTITVTGTTTITESGGGSSQTSGSNTTTSTTVVTEGVETSVAEKCTSSYSQCRQYEFCSESQATGTLYLCAKAFYLCQNTNIQKDLCSEGQLYDPKNNQCVVQLCVLITKEIIVVSTSIETVETGSETGSGSVTTVIDTSNQGETGSSITTSGQQCFSSYSRCKNYETCDDNGQKMSQYLCIDAFEQCNGDKRNLCSTGDFYDPENNACIQKLCPLVTSSVTITVTGTTTITESGGGSSQTSGSNTTTSTTVVTEGVETSVAEKCTSSYSQCRQYEFCSESQATGTLYLCAKAFYLCQNTNIQKDLCSERQLYDPKNNQCVVQLCVLITKEIIVVSTSIETVETGSETGSGSVTTVIDTSNQGETGSSITTTGQQCFSSYSRCKNYETCDDNGQKMSQYLCIDAFEQCNGDKRNLCSTGDFYDPENNACIQKLCPLVTSSVTITVTGTTTITESGGGSSQTSGSNTTTSTTVVTEGVETSVAEKCTSSYSQCRQYEFCSESQATGTLYLCAKAFYLCQNTNIQKDLCSEGQLYDPKNNQCIVHLCVLITKEIIVVSTSIETVETGSETGSGSVTTVTDTSNQGETGSSITTTGQQCFSSYSRCKNYETCDDNGQKMSQYLCIDAFEQCNGDKRNLCSTGDFYDPENNACIQKLCPLVTSSVTITVTGTTTITESGGGSSQTSGSNTTTSTTVVTEGVETSVAEKCTSSYSQCRQYEFCSESQATGTLYLCATAFYLCQNTNIQKDLCSEGQLYDPKNNQCVVQLCVLITKEIIVVSTSIETVETGLETGSGSITTVTDTSNQGETGSSITTTGQQCFSSYSRCKNYETCDDNGQKMSQYLCIDAFEQCNGDKRNLCSTGDFYDPENNACIQKLCPLVTSSVTITVTGTTTITESGGGSSQTSGSNTTTSTTVVTEGVETSVAEKCTSSYSQCRQYEFCSESQATGTLYLCAKAFYLCQNTNIQKDLCSEGQLYDPKKNQCVVQLCVLITKEIIVVSTSIETVETGSETGSGSVTTVTDTSNQGETGSSITTTGQQCFSSYSRCKNYETCDDNGQKMSQYLCIDAFEQCNGDKRNLCSTGDFYDPENNACIQKLCPLVTSSVTITVTGTTTITESGGGSSQTSGSNTTTSTTVVTEGVETSVAEKCTSSYSQCRQYEFCSESQATGTLYLCAKAFYLCQNTNIQKDLCSEGQLYDPNNNQCVVQLCILIVKKVLNYGLHEISSHYDQEMKENITVNSSLAQKPGASNITLTITDLDVHKLWDLTQNNFPLKSENEHGVEQEVRLSCFASYSQCKIVKICNESSALTEGFYCNVAKHLCDRGKLKFDMCETNAVFDPYNNLCVTQLCPIKTKPISKTLIGSNNRIIANEGTNILRTKKFADKILVKEVLNYTETMFCQLKYDFCKTSDSFSKMSIFKSAQYMCQCQETCYFRNEQLSNFFLCFPPLFQAEKGNCSFMADREHCQIGVATLSPLDKGKSFERFQKSISAMTSSPDENASNLQIHFEKLSRRNSGLLCLPNLYKTRDYWIQKEFCSDIAICSKKDVLEIWRVKTLCTHFIECYLESPMNWKLKLLSCPNNQFYSFEEQACLTTDFSTDSCHIFKGGEPASTTLRLFSDKLPSRAKSFLNSRLNKLRIK